MKKIIPIIAVFILASCQSLNDKNERMEVTDGHIDTPVPISRQSVMEIPPIVEQVPVIAAPEPVEKLQTFTVVASDLPANELLFALARDARLNLDIDPSITDRVSINAIDQTLPQILKRVSRQVSLRYYLDGPNLIVEKDRLFTRIYKINYLNMARETSSSVTIATQIASGGSDGGNSGNSTTSVTNEASNNFWATLESNIAALATDAQFTGSVISNRESGTIAVRATSSAHDHIQRFIDQVMGSARKQVLIEATVVEVTLNDDFQAGVDWSRITTGDGWDLEQNLLGATLGAVPFTSATFVDTNADSTVTAAIKALDSFGDVSVMSSPKIMALNNQTSVLKVADNRIYFQIEQDSATDQSGNVTTTFTSTVKTVPVGFVMNVTPFITDDDEIILNIRPTITRILRFVDDPNPNLTVPSPIPEIQIREMESVLRVSNGQTAVIGGLMQDTADTSSAGLPGLHDAQGIGLLFGTKSKLLNKTELVIFLRPRIIDNASIDTNLKDFKRFLRPEVFSSQAN